METFHIIFLFTCDAVHVYTAAMEESEHCHLAFRVLPMGRCACIFCSALLYDETRECVEIVKTHFLSLILLLSFFFFNFLVFLLRQDREGADRAHEEEMASVTLSARERERELTVMLQQAEAEHLQRGQCFNPQQWQRVCLRAFDLWRRSQCPLFTSLT